MPMFIPFAGTTYTTSIAAINQFVIELQSAGTLITCWIPTATETTSNIAIPDARTWTDSASLSGRTSTQGSGVLVTFNGTNQKTTAADTGFPSAAAARTAVALIKPVAINVTDNPIFTYGTASSSQGFFWELNNSKQRVGKFGANSGVATTAQVNGTAALLGVAIDASGNITFYNNGAADGTSTLTSMNTTLNGTTQIADAPSGWGLGNTGNVTTGFVALYSGQLDATANGKIKVAVNRFFGLSL